MNAVTEEVAVSDTELTPYDEELRRTVLAQKIMSTRTKADQAETFEEHATLMSEYHRLRKMWEAKCGQAVIGIEIPQFRRKP